MSLLLTSLFFFVAPAQDVTGVYEVSGPTSNPRVILQETASGDIIGYLVGSSGTWITSGHRSGSETVIELQGRDGGSEDWFGTLRLHPDGSNLDGALEIDKEDIPVYLTQSKLDFVEEPWIWYDETNDIMTNVRRVLDTTGAFTGGSFSAVDGCDFMACGGSVESWTDASGTHTIHTTSSGDCWQDGDLIGTWDPSGNELSGTWNSTNCVWTSPGGSFIGGKVGETNRKHAEELLLSLATFVDDFESESSAAADLFHSAYLSDGVTKADWQSQFSTWFAEYDAIEVTVEGPQEIVTYNDSDVHPWLIDDLRISWKVSAQGLSVSTATVETFWEREEPGFLGPDLRYIGTESGRYVIVGNGEATPLTIGLPIQLSDVNYSIYGVWPFGQHGGGHAEDGHGGLDIEFQLGTLVRAAAEGEILDIRSNTSHLPAVIWDIIQEVRPGVRLQYGEVQDPLLVSVGDVVTPGTPIGSPWEITYSGGTYAMIHFALSATLGGDLCPVEWWDASAQADWDVIWPQCHYSQELCEPFACNDRDAEPPYTATWELETAGSASGPDSILFFRADGYAHDYVYTFFDATGTPTETGVTEGATSPSTLGYKFIADGTGVITFGAVDVLDDEMQLLLESTMPSSMRGAAIYRYQE